jgi:multisubunit Na+/H+ antiporter MnhB subunit
MRTMNIRPLRTLGATLAAVAALVVSLFAGQDLWHYWQAISAGYTEWATSGQGLWMLACGVGELIATVVLVAAAVRLLGSKPLLPFRPSQPHVAVSN